MQNEQIVEIYIPCTCFYVCLFVFLQVIDEYKGKVHYVEIDIVEDPEIAEAAGVNGTPTVSLGSVFFSFLHIESSGITSSYDRWKILAD